MKSSNFLVAVAAIAALTACNGDSGASSGNGPVTAEVVPPPPGGDWSQQIARTPEGGYVMGNPNAAVKLVEFGSMTCPHCAEFDETGFPKLVNDYVKKGQVSFEFRNYVRDGLDLAMSLVARCGEPNRFFPLTEALFQNQEALFNQVQAAPPEQQQALSQSPQGYAQLAGLPQWAAQRGLPAARTTACLTNQSEMDRLVQMNTDANQQFNIPGTPAFVINGELVDGVSSWERLEPELRKALGG